MWLTINFVQMINNQKFCHCIKYQDGFCDVSLTASNFDLDSGDSLTFGNVVNTGSTFGTSMMLNCTRKISSA